MERRTADPVLDLSLFRKPAFTGATIVAFALSASIFSMFLYISLFFQNEPSDPQLRQPDFCFSRKAEVVLYLRSRRLGGACLVSRSPYGQVLVTASPVAVAVQPFVACAAAALPSPATVAVLLSPCCASALVPVPIAVAVLLIAIPLGGGSSPYVRRRSARLPLLPRYP